MMNQCWIIAIICLVFAGLSESKNTGSSDPSKLSSRTATKARRLKGTCRVCARGEYECEPMVNIHRPNRHNRNKDQKIPKNLSIGAAGAAYQVEGAWNVSGKSESVWDRMVHTRPESITDGSNGDIACDQYHKYKEDVQLIKSIGLQNYRFSISWTRLLKPGCGNQINEAGLEYYNNLVNELLKNNIEPIVTLFHWDHPQSLEDLGGWTNEEIIKYFVAYARVAFGAIGDRVKLWLTVNEANIFCSGAYGGDSPPHLAPGKVLNDTGMYLCRHNILKAHALVYRMYEKEFRPTQHGQIAIGGNCNAYAGADANDTESVNTAYVFDCGWVYWPIYKGDYPGVLKEKVALVSKAAGCEKSLLPEFSQEWIDIINGTSDYFAVNHYTTMLVRPDPDANLTTSNSTDGSGLIYGYDPEWTLSTTAPWIYDVPWGMGDMLRWIQETFDDPPIRVTENGWADAGQLDDYGRINYHHGYLSSLLEAVKIDHCKVLSYTMWSFLDDFEWDGGYVQKFGLIGVDFNDTARPRREKMSTAWWRQNIETCELQPVPTES